MGSRIAYYGIVKLGTTLIEISPVHTRGNQNVVFGIDQERAYVEAASCNFVYTWRVWTQEVLAAPASRAEVVNAKANLDELGALEDYAYGGSLYPLCWIEDDAKTTTVTNPESAGSSVNVEIGSLSALGAVANDYVLIIGTSVAQCLLVGGTGTGPDKLVLNLTSDLAGGETIYLVSIYYPSCRYDGSDPGLKEPNKMGRVSFRKSYTFTSGAKALWKA